MRVAVICCVVVSVLVASPTVEGICDVIPIQTWGGSSSELTDELEKPVNLVVVTHTVTAACDTDQECERIVNAIRTTQKQQGLKDMGLSFLVGGNGKIYKGAGWKVGTHTLGHSEKSISMSFIGDFREVIPTEAALTVSQRTLDCFRNSGYLGNQYMLVGHRQLIPTISPGDALQNLIQKWPQWSQNALTRPH